MHEQTLINSLIKKILAVAYKEEATKVVKVSVSFGPLSHLSPPHFKEHFEIAARGTIAEQAIVEAELADAQDEQHGAEILLKSIDLQ